MAGKDRPLRARQQDAALEALEHLQRQIEESRRRRREASDEFEAFVRSLKERRDRGPAPVLAPPQVRTRLRTSELPAREPSFPPAGPTQEERAAALGPAAAERMTPRTDAHAVLADAPAESREAREPAGGPEPPAPAPVAPPSDRRKPAIVVAVLVAVLLFGWWMFRPRPAIAPAPAPAPVQSPAAVPIDPPAAAPVAQRPDPPAELRTLRRVWMRILVNGERTLEREVDPGTTIPFKAGTTVSIRAGDGGAVRLFVGGKDLGLLGVDGLVVTRTVEVPPVSR